MIRIKINQIFGIKRGGAILALQFGKADPRFGLVGPREFLPVRQISVLGTVEPFARQIFLRDLEAGRSLCGALAVAVSHCCSSNATLVSGPLSSTSTAFLRTLAAKPKKAGKQRREDLNDQESEQNPGVDSESNKMTQNTLDSHAAVLFALFAFRITIITLRSLYVYCTLVQKPSARDR